MKDRLVKLRDKKDKLKWEFYKKPKCKTFRRDFKIIKKFGE